MTKIKKVSISPIDRETLLKLKPDSDQINNDFCDYSKVVVRKPWGYEYLIFQNAFVAVWVLYLKPGAETSTHCHPNKKTSLIVLEGEVTCSNLNDSTQRAVGEGLLIDLGVFHQTQALSEKGAFVLEIETPVNKRDLVRLKDKYGRESKGYENADRYSRNTQNYNYLTLTNPEVHHNLKKRFGQCTLTFKGLESPSEVEALLNLDGQDVISVLSGELKSQSGQKILGLGDTVSAEDFKALWGRQSSGTGFATSLESSSEDSTVPTEVLIVKRMDRVIKVSDLIVKFMKKHGAKDIFLVPGDANVHLLDSIGRDEELKFVCAQLEHGASLAAEAASKTNGKLTFLVISSGASGPNAIPGVANAWIDSVPLFVISGQARSDQDENDHGRVRQLGNKALNIVGVVQPITKYALKVTDPSKIPEHLEEAAQIAMNGRPGPVWLDIPIDFLGMTIEDRTTPHSAPKCPPPRANLTSTLKKITRLLREAKRPVLLAGNGIRLSGGKSSLNDLIDTLQIPVLTSRRGADLLSEDHPFFFGRPGMYGQRRSNFIIQNSDLLLSIGSRLSIPFIGRNSALFAREAKKIVVDIDELELQKSTLKIDVPVESDAKEFIEALTLELAGNSLQCREWIKRCQQWNSEFPVSKEGHIHQDAINPYLFVSKLSDLLPEGEVLVADGGATLMYVMQSFQFKPDQRLISSSGLDSPGFSVAGAIGACIAHDRSPVICLCEDRGFQISIHELQTIRDAKLPIRIIVLKSRGHSVVRTIQKDFFGGRFVGTDSELLFGSPPLLQVAQAYGFRTFEISNPENLSDKIADALAQPGPSVCEVRVDNEQELIPRTGFIVKDDGKWIAKPLEDMHPLLGREVLKKSMLIDTVDED